MKENSYIWTDNPTVSGVSICDTDILNDCLMHLKYENKDTSLDGRITNCLLEVPQNINLELKNEALTLKSGSKVIVPNGFEADETTPKFDEIAIDSDITLTVSETTSGAKFIYLRNNNELWQYGVTDSYSGDTGNGGTSWSNGYSLPFCIVTLSNGKVTSIDRIFNGFGYIGDHLWLENIKALISDGRNEDGTCKNIEISTPKIKVHKFANIDTKRVVYLSPDGRLGFISGANVFESTTQPNYTQTYTNKWYNPATNKTYAFDGTNWNESPSIKLFTYEPYNSDKKTVRILDDRFPFRAADYYETVQKSSLAEIQCVVETYKNGDSWYRIWSDGWCQQGGSGNSVAAATVTINLLKPYLTTAYALSGAPLAPETTDAKWSFRVGSRTTSSFTCGLADDASRNGGTFTWQTAGYIA